MGIKMVDTAEPMNENGYPVARAKHIWFDDSESLQKKLDDGSLGGGGASYTQLSQAEYDALTDDEKMNGKEYRTYDTGHIYRLGVSYGKDAYFTSLSQLGLTAPTTVGEVFMAMPEKSMLMLNVEALVDDGTNVLTVTDVPKEFGVLTIEKHIYGRFRIEYSNSLGGAVFNARKWIGALKGSDGTGLVWKEVNTGNHKYTTMAELALDGSTATIQDVIDKVAVGDSVMIRTDAFNNNNWKTQCNGIQWGYLKIEKTMSGLSNIELQEVITPNRRYFGTQSSGKFVGWVQILTEKSDPYACDSYTVLNGTEDLFTLPCGHYVSDKANTTYNYPITDSSKVTAHIYVLGCLNDPANNKGYRIILYFDNKNRMYRINEWWGVFTDNGWQEIATTADHNMKTYTNVTQLGLTSPCSVIDIVKKLPKNSQLIYGSYGSGEHRGGYITDAPSIHGLLEIQKSDYDGCRATMTFTESATNSMGWKRKWLAEFASGNIDTNGVKWHEVAYKAVADVGFSTINQTNGLTAPTGITMTDVSKVNYCIRNGVCYVHIALHISSISAKVNSWTTIADLPKSVIEAVGAMNCESNTVPDCMPIRVSVAGKLTLMYKGTTTSTSDWWSYSFSYPVAE